MRGTAWVNSSSLSVEFRIAHHGIVLTKILCFPPKFYVFPQNFMFFPKNLIVDQKFDFWGQFGFPRKISVFGQNFDFDKILILDQIFDFDQIFNFGPNFQFWTKFSILGKIIDHFVSQKFRFLTKTSIFGQNFDSWPKFLKKKHYFYHGLLPRPTGSNFELCLSCSFMINKHFRSESYNDVENSRCWLDNDNGGFTPTPLHRITCLNPRNDWNTILKLYSPVFSGEKIISSSSFSPGTIWLNPKHPGLWK